MSDPFDGDDKLLTIKEVATLLGVHTNTVRKMIKGGLPFIRIGTRHYRFMLGSVRNYLRNSQKVYTDTANPSKRRRGKKGASTNG